MVTVECYCALVRSTKPLFNFPFFRINMEAFRFQPPHAAFPFPFHQTPGLLPVQSPLLCPSPVSLSPGLLQALPRFTTPPGTNLQTLTFSQEEVDMVLYGYTKNKSDEKKKHALSGLRSGDLSYGKIHVFQRYILLHESY